VFIDVFVGVGFVEGVEAIEQLSLSDGSEVADQSVYEILPFFERVLVENHPNCKKVIPLQILRLKKMLIQLLLFKFGLKLLYFSI